MVDRKPVKPRDRPDCCHQSFCMRPPSRCTTESVIRLVSRQDCCTVRLPDTYSWILIRSDSLLDRFPYEDIGSCLPEEGSQHQVRQPRRKKERVCVIRRTRPREASLTGITEPSLPQLLWEGASLPFDRLNKPALPSTHNQSHPYT